MDRLINERSGINISYVIMMNCNCCCDEWPVKMKILLVPFIECLPLMKLMIFFSYSVCYCFSNDFCFHTEKGNWA